MQLARRILLISAPAVLWAAALALMIREATGTQTGFTNSLLPVALLTSVEMLILYAVLRPWSYERSIARAALASVVFVPWCAVSAAIATRSGRFMLLHSLWIGAVSMLLAALIIAGAVQNIAADVRDRS